MESVIHPPKTLMEVFKRMPEGTLVQHIENELIMSPAPKDIHQKVRVELAPLTMFTLITGMPFSQI